MSQELSLQPILTDKAVQENFRRIGVWTATTPRGFNPGDLAYWDGSQWVVLPIGAPGDFLKVSAAGVPAWEP